MDGVHDPLPPWPVKRLRGGARVHYHVDQLVIVQGGQRFQLDPLRRDAEAGVGLLLGADPDVADCLAAGVGGAGGVQAVSYADSRPGRRRRGGPRLTDRTLNVALGTELYRRIDAAANRYGCAAGMVARYAIEHGMRGALQRLQRELPPDQRPSAATEATEAAERG